MSLEALVKLAKADGAAAEAALLPMLRSFFPALAISRCTVNSGSKVSLNSVNGFLFTGSGEELFFKFHAEEGEEQSLKNSEYYNAATLAKAGWPIITPRAASTRPGQQCVIYEKLSAPTAYDLCGQLDAQFLENGRYDEQLFKIVLKAEEDYLRAGTSVFLESLAPAGAQEKEAPLHQLFGHRLFSRHGTTPRLDLFYTGKPVQLPDGKALSFEEITSKTWVINGQDYPHTLAAIIAATKEQLAPHKAALQPTVLGHGDDHNGNKFLIGSRFTAFDPAFAGRMPALLAPIKATLHNTVLHPFWYYEPERVQGKLSLSFRIEGTRIVVEHDGAKLMKSPLREGILALHQQHVWAPLFAALKSKNMWPADAEAFIAAAAFACPFLALNMLDAARAPQKQLCLYNLSRCVEIFHAPPVSYI